MDILSMILIILGLCAFETVSSIDNAVINAEVLGTMSKKARQWFVTWGIFIAVFLVRGLLPLIIIYLTAPELGFVRSFTAMFSSDPAAEAVERSAPILLMGGGIFLVFLFFHWLFVEPKNYGLEAEKFFHTHAEWFYAIVSVLLTGIVWFAMKLDPMIAFGAVVGSSVFFITHGFKQSAEETERKMINKEGNLTDISKILYLEVIDASFSIDGVLGAFAFTLFVPLILIGNGLGAIVVRQLTVSNIETVKRYKYLKNGAMYSIFALGAIMVANAFGIEIHEWISPVVTIVIIVFFFMKSKMLLDKEMKSKKINA